MCRREAVLSVWKGASQGMVVPLRMRDKKPDPLSNRAGQFKNLQHFCNNNARNRAKLPQNMGNPRGQNFQQKEKKKILKTLRF
nr:hypothetical protein [uncultured Dysosmobacter sp.]